MTTAYDLAVLKHGPNQYWPYGPDLGAGPRDVLTRNLYNGASGAAGNNAGLAGPNLAPSTVLITGYLGMNAVGGIFASTKEFTVEGWIWPTAFALSSGGAFAFNAWASSQDRPFMFNLSDNLIGWNSSGGNSGLQTGGSVATNEVAINRRLHIAAVHQATNDICFYVNGKRVGVLAWGAAQHSGSATTPRIGQPADTFWGVAQGYYWNWAIYEKALSGADIAEHHELGMTGRTPYSRRRMLV